MSSSRSGGRPLRKNNQRTYDPAITRPFTHYNSGKKVLTFFQARPDKNQLLVQREVGWRDASTFSGFCTVHDSVFSPIETAPFASRPEQRFLLAYRAICHEVYQKSAALKALPIYSDLIDRGTPQVEQLQYQDMMRTFTAGVSSGLTSARTFKAEMDCELLARDFGKFSWLTITFSGPLSVVSTGAVTPNLDFEGREIQPLHDLNKDVQPLFVGTAVTDDGGAIVLGWRPEHDAPKKFIASLQDRGVDRLPGSIVQFMFAYIENTYFSEDWWNGLNDLERDAFTTHAVNSNPYYVPPSYKGSSPVPWKITSVLME